MVKPTTTKKEKNYIRINPFFLIRHLRKKEKSLSHVQLFVTPMDDYSLRLATHEIFFLSFLIKMVLMLPTLCILLNFSRYVGNLPILELTV